MQFSVSRTSATSDEQPCEGAVLAECLRRDERVFDDPTKIHQFRSCPELWFKDGLNHRVEHGHIVRDFPAKTWFIEIDDLDALLAFLATHGPCVIQAVGNYNSPHLEIYDSYRE